MLIDSPLPIKNVADVVKIFDNMLCATALVASFFGGDEEKIKLWFRTPNPLFGGVSALELAAYGRSHVVLRIIEEQIEMNKETP